MILQNALSKGEVVVPQPPVLQLSSANIDRHGAYLMDAGTHFYLWLGAAISDRFCMEVFDHPNFQALPEVMVSLHCSMPSDLVTCTLKRSQMCK